MKNLIVASMNPIKTLAARRGFVCAFPNERFRIRQADVPSLVPDQPMSNSQTFQGALNRTEHASSKIPDADFWIGMEGGIRDTDRGMEAFAWMVVKSKQGVIGKAKTATFFLPTEVADLIRQGKELGEADDIVFGKKNSKQANGAVGILSHDLITRTSLYEHAVILALIPHMNPQLYHAKGTKAHVAV